MIRLAKLLGRFLGRRTETVKPRSRTSGPHEATTEQEQEIRRLRALLASNGIEAGGIRPEQMVWIFGAPRTGSTWLSAMMGEIGNNIEWREPYAGDLFGYAYHRRAGDWMRAQREFILGDPYREVWLRSIRTFVLEGANARFPDLEKDGHLIIKEPNGALGAHLLSEALPESRVIFLIRDPRDIVASIVDAQREGSWTARQLGHRSSPVETNSEQFVRQRASLCLMSLEKSGEAYDNHRGPKVLIRYEELRADVLGTLRRVTTAIDAPVGEKGLRQAVEKHAWEKIPEKNKGEGKFYRKAKPGGWREDLTPKQARIVEEVTAPILNEFYPA